MGRVCEAPRWLVDISQRPIHLRATKMTYEYVCEACGHQWETEQSIKDSALKTCVSCGASKAKRLVSGGTGFLLKGGGWYADLYSSPGAGGAKTTEEKASAKSSKAEGSDAKPAGETKSETSTGGDAKGKTPSSASTSSTAAPASTGSAPSAAAASAKAS